MKRGFALGLVLVMTATAIAPTAGAGVLGIGAEMLMPFKNSLNAGVVTLAGGLVGLRLLKS